MVALRGAGSVPFSSLAQSTPRTQDFVVCRPRDVEVDGQGRDVCLHSGNVLPIRLGAWIRRERDVPLVDQVVALGFKLGVTSSRSDVVLVFLDRIISPLRFQKLIRTIGTDSPGALRSCAITGVVSLTTGPGWLSG